MDLKELKELLRTVVDNDISEFEFEQGGVKIRIKRNHLGAASGDDLVVAGTTTPARPPTSPEMPPAIPAPLASDTHSGEGLHTVASPIVGTYYSSSTPGADPYVHVGDLVHEGSVLGIVEAMKLMNEIKSDVTGKIVDILVTNGQAVEYGQKLFLIQMRK